MKGFTKREYFIIGLVVAGVTGYWFLLIATVMGIVSPYAGIPILVMGGLVIYWYLNTKKPKN